MSNIYSNLLEAKPGDKTDSNGAKEGAESTRSSEKPTETEGSAPQKVAEKENTEGDSVKNNTEAAAELVLPKEAEIPTNDETGKFDLNMLQKHIEETRNKASKKPGEDKKDVAKNTGDETISPEQPLEKAEQKASAADKEVKEETAAASKSDSTSNAKQEEKARPDARDVARSLAKELAEESKGQPGAIKDDEATGEFEALTSPSTAKASTETKAESKAETVKEEPAKVEPPKVVPPKEEPAKEEPPEAEAPKEEKKPAQEEKAPAPQLDQTGEDLKAVAPKSGSDGAFGECEPVASESVARPGSQEQKSPSAIEKEGDDAAVIMLCNQILANGIAKGASTVHVEVVDKQVLVHYRTAGQLMVVRKLPKMLMPALTARFRKMGRIENQDNRLPQDGRVKVRMSGKDFSLRLTIVPHTAGGEHILVWIE